MRREILLVAANIALGLALIGLISLPVEPGLREQDHVALAPIVSRPRIMFGDVAEPDRALFAPPALAPVVPPPAVPQPRPSEPVVRPVPERSLRLAGIVANPDMRVAYIAVQGRAELARLTDGDEVEGWRVASIGQRDVRLAKSGQMRLLVLDPPASP